ncbi:MAG TPA: C25 family cysteine peptidase [Anaerolineae bacterium]|nr:C25 family cysteine peptidase [Anaerolineae bacterium]
MTQEAVVVLIGRILAISVLSLSCLAPAASGVSAGDEVGPLVARVQTPDYNLTAGGVEVADYVLHMVPGAPMLPLEGLTFDLPLAGDWELSFESNGSRILDERVAVAAVPVPDLDLNGPVAPQDRAELPSAVPVVDRPDPAIYDANAFYPASPVVAGEPVVQGGQRILPVRVFPFQYNPVTQQLRYHPDLLVTVEVQHGIEGMSPAAPPAGDFYQPTALPGDGVLRIPTKERGLYRLTYADLNANGVPVGPGGANPNTFAVYDKSEQIDIEVTGAGDNSFDDGDLVIFYAVPYDGGRFQDYNVYQFVYGGEVVGQRIAPRTVSASAAPPAASVITQTLHVEFDRDYRSLYPRPSYADHFFDTQLYVNATTPTLTRSYDLALSNPVTATDNIVQVRALIHGGVDQAANPDQSVLLRLNSYDIGAYRWNGSVDHLITASVPAEWLVSSNNRMHLVAALAQLPGGPAYYWISPDWVQISYPALANATDDRLYIEGLVSPTNAVAVSGFSTPVVSVFDVRNPRHPLRLSGVGAQVNGSATTVYWDETMTAPVYALSTDAALLAPGAIERDIPSNWADPDNAYEYVAIVGAQRSYNGTTSLGGQLATAVQPLLDYRAAEGFDVAHVDVQDIYDEWSYGRIDPHAIRSFLSYAYYNWATRPSYVLLVGDGHYDYNQVTSQPLPLLLPPYLADVDPWFGEVPTDNLYVSVDSISDYLPDMAVGRLPANTAAEVTAIVDKILVYEDASLNPAGPWQQRAIYVADNCSDPAGNFHALSNQGRLGWLPTAYTNRPLYYDKPDTFVCPDGTHSDGAVMRAAVRDTFGAGAFYLQWFGHGSQSSWGTAAVFGVSDLFQLRLDPTGQLPFTTAYACLTGYFVWNSSFASRQSLAELMVSTPQRGSIADLSPSGLHVGSALLTLQRGMHQNLFDERIERAGDVVDAAKWYFFANSSSWHDVIDTMVLFGDPALKLRYPTGDLSSSTLAVSDEVAPLGATMQYTLTVSNSSIYTTSLPLAVVDYPQELVTVVNAGGAVDNGDTLSWNLADLSPNSQQVVTFALQAGNLPGPENFDLSVPATLSSQMAPTVLLQAQTQILTAPDTVVSSLAVQRAWLPPGFPLTATLTLSHDGGLPAPSVQVTMTLPIELGEPVWLSSPSLIYDPVDHRITWSGDAAAGSPTTLAFSSVILPSLTICGELPLDALVSYNGSNTPQSALVNLVVPDVDCSGSVDVVDIQQVAARWGSLTGDGIYHARYDLNADDAIDVLDIIAVAQLWN